MAKKETQPVNAAGLAAAGSELAKRIAQQMQATPHTLLQQALLKFEIGSRMLSEWQDQTGLNEPAGGTKPADDDKSDDKKPDDNKQP